MRVKYILSLAITVLVVFSASAQKKVHVSGIIKDKITEETLPFVNVVLKKNNDAKFILGTISNEEGLFSITDVYSGEYFLEASFVGFKTYKVPVYVGSLSNFIDLGVISLETDTQQLKEVNVTSKQQTISKALDKKTYAVDKNIGQSGGSVLQAINNLPGVTAQNGEVQLRGKSNVLILIDGKQTAITGFGSQNGLDNLPASAIDKIEIINNPSAKYDANSGAGIINILLKKEEKEGFNGNVGLTSGLGALWVRKENLPGIRPQYQLTPKINPSLSVNYRKRKINLFLQADNLYTETLNKNEFVRRVYNDGTVIDRQTKRNRDTNFFNSKLGLDWFMDNQNSLTISGLYSQEAIIDRGDEPFFNGNTNESLRLWQFLEDEVLTAVMVSVAFEHKFKQPGRKYNIGFNYTFDREDEKYFFDNKTNTFTTKESFFLIADQKVTDFTFDYTHPTKHGLFEVGTKFRYRVIPTDMQFNPSNINSVLDVGADGKAEYSEIIPALYGNYTYEIKNIEVELGLRVEYVDLKYDVDPNHNTYTSDGYDYLQPFPNARITYKMNARNRFSVFYNRKVDRPDESDIRIFPKYDDAELIKVGNPTLQPQFIDNFELGYKNSWNTGSIYSAIYHRISDGEISRIATTLGDSDLIYNISQNTGKSSNTGTEIVFNQSLNSNIDLDLNFTGYYNQIDGFQVINLYPETNVFNAEKQDKYTYNIKLNSYLKLTKTAQAQLSAIYLAPDIIPQGTIDSRYGIDLGVKKSVYKGKGEFFLNASDILNTMVTRKKITGNNFNYTANNYPETQVIRLGYKHNF